MTKKMVLAVDVRGEKEKQKAMNSVTRLLGIDSLAMDMNEKKLTVIGGVDPVEVVHKLRKKWPHTTMHTLGPAKEPEKEQNSQDDKNKKMVLAVDVRGEKEKQKAMNAVTTLLGIDSLAMDMNEKKLTVIGGVDPVEVVGKLRKKWPHTKILTVDPAKEPEKEPNDEDDENMAGEVTVPSLSECTCYLVAEVIAPLSECTCYLYYPPYLPCYGM